MNAIVVNASRVIEGTLRNMMDRDVSLRNLASADIEKYLLPVSSKPEPSDVPAGPLPDFDHARLDIESMLDQAPAAVPAVTEARSYAPALLQPDILFFCSGDDEKSAEQDIVKLRKACAFRDVPIIVLCELSHSRIADNLVSVGATDKVPLPLQKEVLRARMDRALRPVGTKMPIITQLINPFINATLDIMTTMAGLQVARKDLFLKKNYRLFGDISGIMNFSGKIDGAVVVSFNDDLARDIVARILGVQAFAVTPADLRDGVGEIINIISGNAKAALAGTEFGHEITLPAVVTGQGHEIKHPANAPCIVIIFEADGRPFAVQISMVVKA